MWIGILVDEASSIAEGQAALVSRVDPREGTSVATEFDHLPEDREEHELAQGDLMAVRQLHEGSPRIQGHGDDFDIANVGMESGLDVVGAQDEELAVRAGTHEHPRVEPRR